MSTCDPKRAPGDGPAADLQPYCTTLAGFLRRTVPTLRQRLAALEPLLPPEGQRKLEDESGEPTFPYSLVVLSETLLVEALGPSIALLEAVSSANPSNPRPQRPDVQALLEDLDPG